MNIKSVLSAKVLFGLFNTIFFTCGFIKVVCGFLLLCDPKKIMMSRLLAMPEGGLEEPPFYYVAFALLVTGLSICCISAIGVWAAYIPGYIVLTFYFLLVLSLLLYECAAGVLAAFWPRCYGIQSTRGGAVGVLQNYYAVPDYEYFTSAMDLAQTELKCCGMTSSRNYEMSVWKLRRLGPADMIVPPSCCTQILEEESYLNPAPINQTRCQESQPIGKFRHIPGCLPKVEEWYQQQYFVFMLALFGVAILKLGILLSTVFSCIRLKKRRQSLKSFCMKSVDRKTNENIYDRKLSGLHDEPITAKYIQPNNFYSPRVRNPRIFNSKPNEMV